MHGVIVQLPLPADIPESFICNSVIPEKDVDGFTAQNLGCLVQANGKVGASCPATFLPCTALAVKIFLQNIEREVGTPDYFKGKTAVVVGRSLNVGLPISLLLQVGTHAVLLSYRHL